LLLLKSDFFVIAIVVSSRDFDFVLTSLPYASRVPNLRLSHGFLASD
jgi:hypothetical protein